MIINDLQLLPRVKLAFVLRIVLSKTHARQ